MTETVYKVVRQANNKEYRSVCAFYRESISDSDFDLIYEIGKKTKPKVKGSALFAFDNIKNAFGFAKGALRSGKLLIMECEYGKSDLPKIYVPSIQLKSMVWLWSNINWIKDKTTQRIYIDSDYTCAPPKGTVMCTWIKPISLVDKKEYIR